MKHNMQNNKKKKIISYRFGIFAEILVIVYLRLKFYKILQRRYRSKLGEIDIVAKKGRTIIFIEVKARKNKNAIFEVLTKHQQERIVRSANYFMASNRKYNGYNARFDLVMVAPAFYIKHIKNAWQT